MIPNKKTLVVDLDDTICFSITDPERRKRNNTFDLYEDPAPNIPMIEKLIEAKEKGFSIIIYTARRMMTHKGNIYEIISDVGNYTRDWLERYEVPCDELIFGKPFGVYYIDDKAITPEDFLEVDLDS